MAIEVPSEAKVYTTIYENFKGVDFTNDPSNVYKRRSPGGKNMLPDIDGRPFKRTGWTVDVPYTDFLSAAGSSATEFTCDRVHHFSLGGQDYMMFFTSAGVFYMNETTPSPVLCKLASGSVSAPVESPFPPQIDNQDIPAHSGRSFFFEGNGKAGFYVYVGTELFRFDGTYFWSESAYIPRVLVACDKYGVGTALEAVNLMTRERTVQYKCDEGSTWYVIPNGCQNNTATVKLLNSDGSWGDGQGNTTPLAPDDATYPYSISHGLLTFTDAVPPVSDDGIDHMTITYVPDGNYVIVTTDEETQIETTEETRTAIQDATATADAQYIVKYRIKNTVYIGVDAHTDGSEPTYTMSPQTDYMRYVLNTEIVPAEFTLTTPTTTPTLSDVKTVTDDTPMEGTLESVAYTTKYLLTPDKWVFIDANMEEADTSTTSVEGYEGHTPESYIEWCKQDCIAFGHDMHYSGRLVHYVEVTETITLHTILSYRQSYTYSASIQNTKTVVTEDFQYVVADGEYINHDATAFTDCQRAFVYGSGLYNQVFYSSSTFPGYNSRVWYSKAGDPTYVPDTNYIEAGGDDTHITGMMKVSGYVGIIKQGSALDASVYLAYPTSFDEDATFAVIQSINGVGALSEGAFNVLNEEPLFLSAHGVMGIEVSTEEVDRKVRSRSHYINRKLCAEKSLANAVSFVHDGMYYLAVNNHCYVLDGSQKSSWANEKTNLQYECYYLENTPIQCFSVLGDTLYFTDRFGNLCRFKTESDQTPYRDSYSVGDATFRSSAAVSNMTFASGNLYVTASPSQEEYTADPTAYYTYSNSIFTNCTALDDYSSFIQYYTNDAEPAVGDSIVYGNDPNSSWYTVSSVSGTTVTVVNGVAINAKWDTIADDDSSLHYFKNLKKKGCVVSLLPGTATGVTVSLKADEKDPVEYGKVGTAGYTLPYDYFVRKKVKKYKRLQIICENNAIDQSFGIDQIIKSYTLGNYSKNRG